MTKRSSHGNPGKSKKPEGPGIWAHLDPFYSPPPVYYDQTSYTASSTSQHSGAAGSSSSGQHHTAHSQHKSSSKSKHNSKTTVCTDPYPTVKKPPADGLEPLGTDYTLASCWRRHVPRSSESYGPFSYLCCHSPRSPRRTRTRRLRAAILPAVCFRSYFRRCCRGPRCNQIGVVRSRRQP